MNIITLEESAFYELLNKVVAEIKQQQGQAALSKWVDGKEAMEILKITSRTTLQKLRDEGQIRYSQPMPKVLLYDRESILKYIEKHAKGTF